EAGRLDRYRFKLNRIALTVIRHPGVAANGSAQSGRSDDKLRGPRRADGPAVHLSRLTSFAPQDDGIGRVDFKRSPTYRGSRLDPIKNLSTACAAWRPSRIAQTTSDCPRRMSPAVKTFSIEVR